LHKMHKTWPFFRMLIGSLEMVVSKTDMGIASRYAELARASSTAFATSGRGRSRRCSRSPATWSCSRAIRRWRARCATACRTSIL
jgi:hypothetical protein